MYHSYMYMVAACVCKACITVQIDKLTERCPEFRKPNIIVQAPPPKKKQQTNKLSSFWFPRVSPQTRMSAFFVFLLVAMKRCPIAAKIAGSIGILPRCVFIDFFTYGYERFRKFCCLSLSPYFMYGEFCQVPTTAYTCVTYFTVGHKKK